MPTGWRSEHAATVFDARDKLGGLNEYGIAAYKTVDDFAQREVQFVLDIGGIAIKSGVVVGRDISLQDLRAGYDALFLAIGLGTVNTLSVDGNELEGVRDAIDFIAELRQAGDYGAVDPGRRVVVVGGGMTAIDAAVQSRLLGAEEVTIAYRRGPGAMNASVYEQEIAQTRGVLIRHFLQPRRLLGRGGSISAVEFERMQADGDRLIGTGEIIELRADRVYRAIGQLLNPTSEKRSSSQIQVCNGRILIDKERRTSVEGIWAGGDCVASGKDLTVTAVEDGKQAAESIHKALSRKEVNHRGG